MDHITNTKALQRIPPAKWGEGYKSNKRTEYPHPDEYTLDGKTTLDAMGDGAWTVDHITNTNTKALQRIQNKRRRLTGPDNWEKRLALPDNVWAHLAELYTSPMLTARDTHLHYKHITHRRIAHSHGQQIRGPRHETAHVDSRKRTTNPLHTWENARGWKTSSTP